MVRLHFFILTLLAFARATYGQQMSPPDVKTLLAKIHERRVAAPHVQANFHEEKTIHLMNKPIVSAGKVWFEPPDKFRREVSGSSSSLTVSNGHDLWIYYPDLKTAEHYSLGKRSPLDAAIAAINTALNIENVESSFSVAGSKLPSGYQLELTPRSPAMKRMFQKFEIRLSNDLFAERTEMLQPNGDRIVTSYTNHSRAAIPASEFEFTPPSGADVSTPLGR